eukprot:TRINITY_DN1400_c0_g1_i1.p1 TRINITY_DN1400_c0_g1~~TRINITY_DN1400_c0_g1_i1.p1  ORF type:complete len:565 (-),score=98.15 TRINITY_DN1400_c0_g1_i1:1386-3080(-)
MAADCHSLWRTSMSLNGNLWPPAGNWAPGTSIEAEFPQARNPTCRVHQVSCRGFHSLQRGDDSVLLRHGGNLSSAGWSSQIKEAPPIGLGSGFSLARKTSGGRSTNAPANFSTGVLNGMGRLQDPAEFLSSQYIPWEQTRSWSRCSAVAQGGSSATQTSAVNGAPPGAPVIMHRVQQGETLWDIAWNYNTTIGSLMRANGIQDGNVVLAETTLVIPQGNRTPSQARTSPSRAAAMVRERMRAQRAQEKANAEAKHLAEQVAREQAEAEEKVSKAETVKLEAAEPTTELTESEIVEASAETSAVEIVEAATSTIEEECEAAEDASVEEGLQESSREAFTAAVATLPDAPPSRHGMLAGGLGFVGAVAVGVGLMFLLLRSVFQKKSQVPEDGKQEALARADTLATKKRAGNILRIDRTFNNRREMLPTLSPIPDFQEKALVRQRLQQLQQNRQQKQQEQKKEETQIVVASKDEAEGFVNSGSAARRVVIEVEAAADDKAAETNGAVKATNDVSEEEAMAAMRKDLEEVHMSYNLESYQAFLRDSGTLKQGRFRGGMPGKFRERGKK